MPLLKTSAGGNVKGVAASTPAAKSSSSKSNAKSGSAKPKAKSDKPKKEKEDKKDKKDMGPSKPKSGKAVYIAEHKEKFKTDNPEVKGLKIAHGLGAQWKELDEATKEKYESAAKREMAEWKVEYKKWEKENPDRVAEIENEKAEKKEKARLKKEEKEAAGDGKSKAKKKQKRPRSDDDDEDETSEDEQPKQKKSKKSDSAKPKKPLTSFMRFANDKRPGLKEQNIKGKESATKLGEMWRELKDSEKEPYAKAYNDEMVKWKKRMAECKSESENEKAGSDDAEDDKENGDAAPASAAAANGDKAEAEGEAEAEAEAPAEGAAAPNGEADAKNNAE